MEATIQRDTSPETSLPLSKTGSRDPLPLPGLRGNLETMGLADLLQWMGAGRKTGALHLEREKVATRIYFREGRVVGCSSEDPSRLIGQFLLFHGIITEDTLRRAMGRHETTGQTLPDVLLGSGDITSEEFREHLALKAEETMLGLFDWEDGAFQFFPGVPPDAKTTRAYLEVQDLLLRGMQRIDDRKRIQAVFHGPGIVVRRTSVEPPPRMIAQWSSRQIYQAVEGDKSVGEIVLRVHGTDFQVTRCLFEMLQEGLIEIVASQDGRQLTARHPEGSPPPAAADTSTGKPAPEHRGSPPGPPGTSGTGPSPRPAPAAHLAEHDPHPGSLVLDEARRLLKQGEFEKVMELVEAPYRRDPNDALLRSVFRAAEAGFVERIALEDLPPHKVPVLVASRERLASQKLSPAEECLLDLSDGTWDVKSLTWVVPMRTADVLIALKRLLKSGAIELRDPS